MIGALNPNFVEVKAIADIRPFNQFRAFHGDWGVPVRPGLMSVYGWKTEAEARQQVKVYGPYQELLENAKKDGIEAIIIATPLAPARPDRDRRHAAGAARDHREADGARYRPVQGNGPRRGGHRNVYLAIGHQRHYNIKYWQAQDWIKRGLLGELHMHPCPVAS